MERRKAFRFRIKPSPEQVQKFWSYSGQCRFVWNKCLSINLKRLSSKHLIMRYCEMDFWTKLWKRSDEYGFLNECPAHCIQQKLKDLDRAFKDAFDKKQLNKRMPKMRKKGQPTAP